MGEKKEKEIQQLKEELEKVKQELIEIKRAVEILKEKHWR
jgi:hypothetical protein